MNTIDIQIVYSALYRANVTIQVDDSLEEQEAEKLVTKLRDDPESLEGEPIGCAQIESIDWTIAPDRTTSDPF